jgi:hypothetical protein
MIPGAGVKINQGSIGYRKWLWLSDDIHWLPQMVTGKRYRQALTESKLNYTLAVL